MADPGETILDPHGNRTPWGLAAGRARGGWRAPPGPDALDAHEAGDVTDLDAECREAVRAVVWHFVRERGLPGGRARTAALVGVSVEILSLRAEAENARWARRRSRGG